MPWWNRSIKLSIIWWKEQYQSPPRGTKFAFSLASPLAICCLRHPWNEWSVINSKISEASVSVCSWEGQSKNIYIYFLPAFPFEGLQSIFRFIFLFVTKLLFCSFPLKLKKKGCFSKGRSTRKQLVCINTHLVLSLTNYHVNRFLCLYNKKW
jgi:hypothetical protein